MWDLNLQPGDQESQSTDWTSQCPKPIHSCVHGLYFKTHSTSEKKSLQRLQGFIPKQVHLCVVSYDGINRCDSPVSIITWYLPQNGFLSQPILSYGLLGVDSSWASVDREDLPVSGIQLTPGMMQYTLSRGPDMMYKITNMWLAELVLASESLDTQMWQELALH